MNSPKSPKNLFLGTVAAALLTMGCGGPEGAAESAATSEATLPAAESPTSSEKTAPASEQPPPEPVESPVDVAALDEEAYLSALPETAELSAIFPQIEFTQKDEPNPMDRAYLFPICDVWPEPGSEGDVVGAINSWKTSDELAPAIRQTTVIDVLAFEDEAQLDEAWQMASRLREECESFESRAGDTWKTTRPAGTPDLEGADVLVAQSSNTSGAGALTILIIRRGSLVAQTQLGTVGTVMTGTNLASDVHRRFPSAHQLQQLGELLLSGIETLERG